MDDGTLGKKTEGEDGMKKCSKRISLDGWCATDRTRQ